MACDLAYVPGLKSAKPSFIGNINWSTHHALLTGMYNTDGWVRRSHARHYSMDKGVSQLNDSLHQRSPGTLWMDFLSSTMGWKAKHEQDAHWYHCC